MAGLERLRLESKRSEASSLLAVEDPGLIEAIGADAAFWICHDEGGLDTMVSLVAVEDAGADADWSVRPTKLVASGGPWTDAEALARVGDTVFVFGSSFVGKSGSFDERRGFVARFSEREAAGGSADAQVLDLGAALVDLVWSTLDGVDLLTSDTDDRLINVEGAGFVGHDLFLGLRWPVAVDGQPLLVRIPRAAGILTNADWSVDALRAAAASALAIDVGATRKRPAGIRGMAVVNEEIHLVTGQTDRNLAAKKVKAGAARHVRLTSTGGGAQSEVVQNFEGFRKVEGVASMSGRGWIYALDDEDAVVLVLGSEV